MATKTVLKTRPGARVRRGAAAVALIAAASLWAAPAQALNWRIAPAESQIAFRYEEDGEPGQGAFGTFEGTAEFDAARPQRARLDIEIRIDSIKLPDSLRTSFVQTETWFDSAQFPTATFRLERITPAAEAGAAGGPRPYDVEGVLTIKGESRPLATQIMLTLEPRRARAVGEVRFDRRDFRIGDDFGALFVEIGSEIAVAFDIVARRI